MKLLILGGDTEIGLQLAEHLHERQIGYLAVTDANPVMQNFKALKGLLARHKPTQVVNLYSYQLLQTDDPANYKRAAEYIKYLVAACNACELPLIHLADAAIYQGKPVGFYREYDKPDNSDPKAKRLYKTESYVRRRIKKHIILRTTAVFSAYGDNLLTRLMAAISGNSVFECQANERICPTSVADIARVIAAVCEQINCQIECWGIYHYSSSKPTTLPDFVEAVMALASQFYKVHADNLSFLRRDANEIRMVLSSRKLKYTFGIKQRHWRESLPAAVREYYERQSAVPESTSL